VAEFFESIQGLSISQTVRSSLWVFPALECLHLYSMVFLIASVATFDMRLMGFKLVREAQSISKMAKLVLKLASICFGVNFLTGLLLFGSKASDYYVNWAFQLKLLLIVIAVTFHGILLKRASKWDAVPANGKMSGAAAFASLLSWVGVIAASRWIAFA
jgi:hypothetical protein